MTLMNIDLSPVTKATEPLWKIVKQLFNDHSFLTVICAFLIVTMCLSFYRLLRSISPALVGFILLLMLGILILHWTQTRTEPPFLSPFIDWLAPFFPAPVYQGVPTKPLPHH
jgi:membrane-bound metal-dependent hydrolase YbcI (DUF457 family)